MLLQIISFIVLIVIALAVTILALFMFVQAASYKGGETSDRVFWVLVVLPVTIGAWFLPFTVPFN